MVSQGFSASVPPLPSCYFTRTWRFHFRDGELGKLIIRLCSDWLLLKREEREVMPPTMYLLALCTLAGRYEHKMLTSYDISSDVAPDNWMK